MLYELYESMYTAWAPWRVAAAASEYATANPLLPPQYNRAATAGFELFERVTRRYEKPSFDLRSTRIGGREVEVIEERVCEKPFGDLVRFRRDTSSSDPRVLLVAPMSGHFATLVRGTAEALLPEHDVYVTDWRNARDVPMSAGSFDLDDYIDYVSDFMRHLGPDVHAVAICQAAVPVLAAVSLMAADGDRRAPRTMTLMGGPIDTRRSPTAVNELAVCHSLRWFEDTMLATVPIKYAGSKRLVRPGFLQLGAFMAMNPDRHVGSHLRFFEDLVHGEYAGADAHRRFYDEYLSVMDITAEFYLQTVRTVFQEFHIARGIMTSRGRPVEPSAITDTALMTVEGERDDISGSGQTVAAHELCTGLAPSMRTHHEQADAGHFGIFSGRHWRGAIMPRVREFIREHE